MRLMVDDSQNKPDVKNTQLKEVVVGLTQLARKWTSVHVETSHNSYLMLGIPLTISKLHKYSTQCYDTMALGL